MNELRAPELLKMAIQWLKSTYPNSIIVTEMSVADAGAARIDVAAITETHIVGVEIKGYGDSLSRLDRQGLAYGMAAREMWLLPCVELAPKAKGKLPAGWGILQVHGDIVREKNKSLTLKAIDGGPNYLEYEKYVPYGRGHLSPVALCGTLWRDELMTIAIEAGLPGVSQKMYVHELAILIEDEMPVTQIHDHMINALRQREWHKPVMDCRIKNLTALKNPINQNIVTVC